MGFSGSVSRHAVVDRVDDAADGLAAVAQGRRAAHDLDALRRQRIDRHAVIGPDIGDIEAADAVFENAHAVGVEAADDGPAGAGREAGAGDARFVRQGVGEVGAALLQNLVAVDACSTMVANGSASCAIGEAVTMTTGTESTFTSDCARTLAAKDGIQERTINSAVP